MNGNFLSRKNDSVFTLLGKFTYVKIRRDSPLPKLYFGPELKRTTSLTITTTMLTTIIILLIVPTRRSQRIRRPLARSSRATVLSEVS